jgi:hypothetical protein
MDFKSVPEINISHSFETVTQTWEMERVHKNLALSNIFHFL